MDVSGGGEGLVRLHKVEVTLATIVNTIDDGEVRGKYEGRMKLRAKKVITRVEPLNVGTGASA